MIKIKNTIGLKVYILGLISIIFLSTCIKEEFNDISTDILYNPELHAPILQGTLKLYDIIEEHITDEDSLLVHNPDSSMLLYILEDSIVSYSMEEFINIPNQATHSFRLDNPSSVDIPVLADDTIIIPFAPLPYPVVDTIPVALEEDMRIDSIYINSGSIDLEFTSTFGVETDFHIKIPNILIGSDTLNETFTISRGSGTYSTSVPLTNAKLYITNTASDTGIFLVEYWSENYFQNGDVILADGYLNFDVTIQDLESFDVVFGYAGTINYYENTIIDLDLGDIPELTGTFAVKHPTVNFYIDHSFGLPLQYDLDLKGYFEDGDSVVMSPAEEILNYSTNYLFPDAKDTISFNKTSVPDIVNFLVFPPPEQLGIDADITFNPEGETSQNFVLNNSKIVLNLEIEVPFEFDANIELRDTMELDIDIIDDTTYIEYVILHYRFSNYFPLSVNPVLYLLDTTSIINPIVDTIILNQTTNGYLLEAAPVNPLTGITDRDRVQEFRGSTSITETEIENLFNVANKAIISANIKTADNDGATFIKLMSNYTLEFKFNLETKLKYERSFK